MNTARYNTARIIVSTSIGWTISSSISALCSANIGATSNPILSAVKIAAVWISAASIGSYVSDKVTPHVMDALENAGLFGKTTNKTSYLA